MRRGLGRIVIFAAAMTGASAPPPGPGISETLAGQGADDISSLRYELKFVVPELRTEPVHGWETIRFTLRAPGPVVLDFDQPRDRVLSVRSGGRTVEAGFADGHVTIPPSTTR